MKKIIIKSMEMSNFKGIAHLKLDFNDGKNEISAKNGAGKTSIKLAWEWVLGQNVDKPLPEIVGKELPPLTTKVEVILDVDGYEYKLERTNTPKYDKDVKTGNENSYLFDGFEVGQVLYKQKVSDLIGDNVLEHFPILINKDYFNQDTTKWKWNDRRKVLFQLSGANEIVKEIESKQDYDILRNYLQKGYATNDIKTQLAKEKKTLKDEQQKNMVLIEQKQSEINEYLGIDFEKVSQELSVAKQQLTKLNNASKKQQQTETIQELTDEILQKTQDLTKIQIKQAQEMQKLNEQMLYFYNKCNDLASQITMLKTDVCPTCHQKVEHIDEEKLADLQSEYNANKQQFDNLKAVSDNLTETELERLLKNEIQDLNSTLESEKMKKVDNLSSKKKIALESQISDLERQMAKKEFLKSADKQVRLWKQQNGETADKVVEIEKKETALKQLMKEEVDTISTSINSKFTNGISWNLYNRNLNGELEECCVCCYNSVPYSACSYGERNTMDLECLKVLQDYFNVNLTFFFDNKESVTIPYETDRQVVELKADEKVDSISGCTKIKDLY